MNRDRFVADILHGGDRGPGATLLRALLTPLALLHQAILEVYLFPFRIGLRKRYHLSCPVIAIGNLSSGGTGKTPMAALVAGFLRDQGQRVVLLSRGHGGSGESGRTPRLVSDGKTVFLTPTDAGDEPVLLARSLPGVPVIVGRDRRRSGRLAVERFAPEVIVLDDALQYWQLHRDLDIVLLDARVPFDNGWVLPRGLLREPPSHLSRAGIVVLTRADRVSPEDLERAKTQIHRLTPRAAVFAASHAPLGWVRDGKKTLEPPGYWAEKRVFAFSGIADGAAFVQTVAASGAQIVDSRAFSDHFAYDAAVVGEMAASAQAQTVVAVVTTEKDMVKVAPLWPAGSDFPPLYALRIGMQLEDPGDFFARLTRVGTAHR